MESFIHLTGYLINEIFEVVVTINNEEVVLCDTIILALDNGFIQLITDPSCKKILKINVLQDVVIEGDYSDMTAVEFRKVNVDSLPVKIVSYYKVSEKISHDGDNHFVGLFIIGETNTIELSIIMHLDDIEIGGKELLFNYISCIIPNDLSILIENVSEESDTK